jgi:hypothetical protein
MKTGAFQSVEDFLIQALNPPLFAPRPSSESITRTGAELVAAMQASPYKDVEIEPVRTCFPMRGVGLRWSGCSTPTSSRNTTATSSSTYVL